VTIIPFAIAAIGALGLREAAWASIALALATLFAAGAYIGRMGGKNPWIRGLRMAGFGLLAFTIGFLIDSLA
jgi:VIT1/CCC1 family predicted Fe2+/Mn2+ transporter